MKKKVRYVSPRLTGTSALLLELICSSVLFNVQVQELDNINTHVNAQGVTDEPMYFEF